MIDFVFGCCAKEKGNDNDARNYVYVLGLETRYYPNIDGFERETERTCTIDALERWRILTCDRARSMICGNVHIR